MSSDIKSVLTDKFIKGLKEYNLSYEQIQKWKYCGGNQDRHLNYFRICCPGEDLPERVDYCVCGHKIIENCYITSENGDLLLVLGNCCIKKFIPKSSRTCEKCGDPHKNRTVNRCNDCRYGICDICNKICNKKYKKCYHCKFGK
jgi:hypothetical protein